MTVVKAAIELIIWFVFFLALFHKKSVSKHIPGVMIFFLFAAFYIVAIILSDSINFDAYSYFRHYLNAFMILAAAYMYQFSLPALFKINRFIFLLFAIQIAASVVKFFLIGQYEEYVGTIVITTGSLNTIFPLIAIAFMIYAYLFLGKRNIYILYAVGFLFMGWVGDKRGIYFYLVIILFMIFWKRFRDKQTGSFVPKSIVMWSPVILLSLAAIFYIGVRMTPTLNPERKVWGSYDAQFLSTYIYVYNIKDHESGDYRGRYGGTYFVLNEFFTGNGIMIKQDINARTILTGFGADNYVGDVGQRIVKQREAGIVRVRGLIDTGFTQSLMATGIAGVILLVWFYMYYISKVSKISRNTEINPYWKTISSATFMTGMIFLLDFFTYSSTFNTINAVYLTFFFFVGQLLKPDLLTNYNSTLYPDSLFGKPRYH